MVRLDAKICAVAVALTFNEAAHPLPAFAQQAPAGTGPSASVGAAINYETARLERRLVAVRASGTIVLDGMLDEPAWSNAPFASHFVQNDPREGEPATFDTEVRLLYDDDALYFGVFAKDDEPGRLIVNDLKKDFNTGNSDGFRIILDTFHDERNGYQFATNPAGAKWDSQMSNEGRESERELGRHLGCHDAGHGDGLVRRNPHPVPHAEVRKQRHADLGTSTSSERFGGSTRTATGRPCHASTMSSAYRSREPLKECVGCGPVRISVSSRTRRAAPTPSARQRRDGDFDAGLDVKYGVTTGLIWDFTVNTDFSQVEADEQQINLSRFSLFFPEKRDFFLENSGIFQFGTNAGQFGGGGGGGGAREMQLFFSRRIGLSDEGEPIPILGGTRLTGRQGAYSVGVLNIQQREQSTHPVDQFHSVAPAPRHSGQFRHRRHRAQQGTRRAAFQPRRRVRREFPFRRSHSQYVPRQVLFPGIRDSGSGKCICEPCRLQLSDPHVAGTDRLQRNRRAVQRRDGLRAAAGYPQLRRPVRPLSTARIACRNGCGRCSRTLNSTYSGIRTAGLDTSYHGVPLESQPPGRVERRNRRQPEDRSDSGTVHDQQFKRNRREPRPIRVQRILRVLANERGRPHIVQQPILDGHVLRRVPAEPDTSGPRCG